MRWAEGVANRIRAAVFGGEKNSIAKISTPPETLDANRCCNGVRDGKKRKNSSEMTLPEGPTRRLSHTWGDPDHILPHPLGLT
ncbi:hypothetical protein CDAR_301661 [Caerostris darwini]|uniref:Uncharacterized protein n=1 Tax=Caerostris darwini TaxID=1538125 RepID=A0AAV4N6W2_9ARAC|nr:hypothetical protein CDAR_301661 [Caerostris darwini]